MSILGLKPLELLIILAIILLLFGVGRISKLGGELGSGIKAFKEGLTGKKSSDEDNKTDDTTDDTTNDPDKQDNKF